MPKHDLQLTEADVIATFGLSQGVPHPLSMMVGFFFATELGPERASEIYNTQEPAVKADVVEFAGVYKAVRSRLMAIAEQHNQGNCECDGVAAGELTAESVLEELERILKDGTTDATGD